MDRQALINLRKALEYAEQDLGLSKLTANQKIQSKGKDLEEDSDAIEYLRDAAKLFLDQELSRLKMLMVV